MDIMEKLRELGGSAGGVFIYYSAKALATSLNLTRSNKKLWSSTKKQLKPYFSRLNLDNIRWNINAALPADYIEFFGGVSADAMTFGNKIYFNRSNIQNKKATIVSKGLLVHELVHSDQVRRMGETTFAAAYGVQYLEHGYDNMPLENEARALQQQFIDNNGGPPPKPDPSIGKNYVITLENLACIQPTDSVGILKRYNMLVYADGIGAGSTTLWLPRYPESTSINKKYYFNNDLRVRLEELFGFGDIGEDLEVIASDVGQRIYGEHSFGDSFKLTFNASLRDQPVDYSLARATKLYKLVARAVIRPKDTLVHQKP